jgi:energy-coupling factor transporter ATP-binding protein EcfA2
LAIASVLMLNPEYLILDEPTASLDKERIEVLSQVLEELKKKNIGMLIISHNKDFIERHKDRIINLEGGYYD